MGFSTQRRRDAEAAEGILELGLCPRPQTTLNHRRLARIRGMGRSPISKIFYMIYMFYTVKNSASPRLCASALKTFVIFVATNIHST